MRQNLSTFYFAIIISLQKVIKCRRKRATYSTQAIYTSVEWGWVFKESCIWGVWRWFENAKKAFGILGPMKIKSKERIITWGPGGGDWGNNGDGILVYIA